MRQCHMMTGRHIALSSVVSDGQGSYGDVVGGFVGGLLEGLSELFNSGSACV